MKYADRKKEGYYYTLIQSKEWQRLRKRKWTAEEGLCERCRKNGIITPAVAVHHIRPVLLDRNHVNMQQRCFDYSNLMCVCQACHEAMHAELKSQSRAKRLEGVKNEANEMAKRMFGQGIDPTVLEE